MDIGFHVNCPLFLPDFNETRIFSTDFEKYPDIEFHENPLGGSRFVLFGRTDRWKDIHDEDTSCFFKIINKIVF